MAATIEQKKEKRKKEIEILLNTFVSKWNNAGTDYEISLIQDAAEKVSEFYFDIHTHTIQPYLKQDAKSSRFKVASGTEFACIFVKPITSARMDTFQRRQINALLSAHVAMSILFSISFDEIKISPASENDINRVRKVIVEHIKWLTHLNTHHDLRYNIPTFLNSNFWHSVSELIPLLDLGISVDCDDIEY